MRYLIAAAVMIMLFVLPAGSWWYLQSGFDYRKQILIDIAPKRAVLKEGLDKVSKVKAEELLREKVTILATDSILNSKQLDIISRISEKYGNRDFFQFKTGKDLDVKTALPAMSVNLDSIYLIDKDLVIRSMFSWSDSDITKLVEQTAALLPVPKRQTISLKRDLKDESGE